MKFCPVVPEICRGQVHGPQKERRKRKKEKNKNNNNNNNKKRSKNNKSPRLNNNMLVIIKTRDHKMNLHSTKILQLGFLVNDRPLLKKILFVVKGAR